MWHKTLMFIHVDPSESLSVTGSVQCWTLRENGRRKETGFFSCMQATWWPQNLSYCKENLHPNSVPLILCPSSTFPSNSSLSFMLVVITWFVRPIQSPCLPTSGIISGQKWSVDEDSCSWVWKWGCLGWGKSALDPAGIYGTSRLSLLFCREMMDVMGLEVMDAEARRYWLYEMLEWPQWIAVGRLSSMDSCGNGLSCSKGSVFDEFLWLAFFL